MPGRISSPSSKPEALHVEVREADAVGGVGGVLAIVGRDRLREALEVLGDLAGVRHRSRGSVARAGCAAPSARAATTAVRRPHARVLRRTRRQGAARDRARVSVRLASWIGAVQRDDRRCTTGCRHDTRARPPIIEAGPRWQHLRRTRRRAERTSAARSTRTTSVGAARRSDRLATGTVRRASPPAGPSPARSARRAQRRSCDAARPGASRPDVYAGGRAARILDATVGSKRRSASRDADAHLRARASVLFIESSRGRCTRVLKAGPRRSCATKLEEARRLFYGSVPGRSPGLVNLTGACTPTLERPARPLERLIHSF